MTLELQGLKKVREQLKSNPTVDLVFASEWSKKDLRAIEVELNQTLYESISHDKVDHRSEICPRCRLKLLISAIHSAVEESQLR